HNAVGHRPAWRHAVARARAEAQFQLDGRIAMAGNEQTIIDLDRKRMQAMAAEDVATLEAVLAGDLGYTHSSARADTTTQLDDGQDERRAVRRQGAGSRRCRGPDRYGPDQGRVERHTQRLWRALHRCLCEAQRELANGDLAVDAAAGLRGALARFRGPR